MRDAEKEDAQRVLEAKALANVRALVDKVEAEDRGRTVEAVTSTLKLLPLFLAALVLVVAALVTVIVTVRSVDFAPPKTAPEYIERALARIEKQADRHMKSNTPGRVRLSFTIGPDGRAGDIKVIQTSWNGYIDRQAEIFVERAQPFGPLPPGVSGPLSISRVFRFETTEGSVAVLKIDREPGDAGKK